LNAIVEVKKLTGKKKTTRPDLLQAEEIYKLYPAERRVAKQRTLTSIAIAIKDYGFEFVKERTRIYATVWEGRPDVIPLCPHSSTWFHQKRYNDDPLTWGAKPSVINAPLVTQKQVSEKIKQLGIKDDYGWAASFHRHWSHPKKNWKYKNGQQIDWEIELSKQLNIWQSEAQAKEREQ